MHVKKIVMFTLATCPYCKAALRYMDKLAAKNPEYGALEIEKIDESIYPDVAGQYDYHYVPTYYVDGEKLHEGAANLDAVKRVFDAALEG